MIYNGIFQEKQHYITVRDRRTNRGRKKALFNEKQLQRIISHQRDYQDLFITKYPRNRVISCIILDFDNKSKFQAYKDVRRAFNITKDKGANPVIVNSTNKGFHLYIQTPPIFFRNTGVTQIHKSFNYKTYFNYFIDFLIDGLNNYESLDDVNTSAGFGGNIRVIGSIHPSTGERVEIFNGDFVGCVEPNDEIWECQQLAIDAAKDDWRKHKIAELNRKAKSHIQKVEVDPVRDNDLRELMPQLFGGSYKSYGGYVFMQCPFHDDHSPSCLITHDFYKCQSCGAKGNWWTLYKQGYVDMPSQNVDILK